MGEGVFFFFVWMGEGEREDLGKQDTSSSDKFILKLSLHHERTQIISRKNDNCKELKKFQVLPFLSL